MTEKIQPGKFVSLTYSIKDEADILIEQNDIPVGYVYGGDTELLGGMDKAILNMSEGDEAQMQVSPENGFGDINPDLIFIDDLENVPEQFRQIGAEVQMQNEAGETMMFYVTKIENNKVTVDGNHPLAGKNLTLKIKILEVRDATEDDMETSGIHSAGSPTIN